MFIQIFPRPRLHIVIASVYHAMISIIGNPRCSSISSSIDYVFKHQSIHYSAIYIKTPRHRLALCKFSKNSSLLLSESLKLFHTVAQVCLSFPPVFTPSEPFNTCLCNRQNC